MRISRSFGHRTSAGGFRFYRLLPGESGTAVLSGTRYASDRFIVTDAERPFRLVDPVLTETDDLTGKYIVSRANCDPTVQSADSVLYVVSVSGNNVEYVTLTAGFDAAKYSGISHRYGETLNCFRDGFWYIRRTDPMLFRWQMNNINKRVSPWQRGTTDKGVIFSFRSSAYPKNGWIGSTWYSEKNEVL